MYNGSLVIAGETMPLPSFSMKTEPDFLALMRILQEADVAFAHEEMVIHSFEGYCVRPFELMMIPYADPTLAHELRWAGIDMMSTAGNHCGEWGEAGYIANNKALDDAGIVHAGTGINLEEATAPAYFESKAGRVALIDASTGHFPYDAAGLAKYPVRGRPGLNPIGVLMKYILDQEHADMLKKVWKSINLDKAMRGDQIRIYARQQMSEGDFYLDFEHVYESYIEGFFFGIGDEPGIVALPNKWDVERNLKMIKEAKSKADIVLFAHHNQCAEGNRDWLKPASFIPPLAKACIDAGADAYIGIGWHRELGIEIYKGKPLFYSCGNFLGGGYPTKALPADTYQGVGLDMNLVASYTPQDAREAARAPPGGFFDYGAGAEATRTGGIVNRLAYEKGELSEIKLYPYVYGKLEAQKTGDLWDGRCYLASGENAKKILEWKKKLSEQYGTSIEIKGDVGTIAL